MGSISKIFPPAVTVACLVALSCASTAETQTPQAPLMTWERAVDGMFENKGVAEITQLNTRWTLSVRCAGTHVTYLDPTSIDLAGYRGAYVRARYRWVDREVEDPRCVRQPCANIRQRLIALDRLERLQLTADQARAVADQCK